MKIQAILCGLSAVFLFSGCGAPSICGGGSQSSDFRILCAPTIKIVPINTVVNPEQKSTVTDPEQKSPSDKDSTGKE